MTSIIRDNTAPLWRPDLYRVFALLSLTQTPVRITTRILEAGKAGGDIVLSGCLTDVKGLECVFTVNDVIYPENGGFLTDPSCEYSAVLATNTSKGTQLIEYSGNARILDRAVDANGVLDTLKMHFSLPGKMRPLRRHNRQKCDHWKEFLPGLALLDEEITSRRQLLALMRHYYRKQGRIVPKLVNISPGGVCLRTEDAIARRLMQGSDRYLFFFFTKSPLEEKIPWVFMGRKVGTYKTASQPENGLRIQFLKELDWQNGEGDELNWQDVANQGSVNLKRMLEEMPVRKSGSSVSA